MLIKKIMVCLDGSKNSLRGLNTAISMAKQTNATIVGIHSLTKFSPFTAVHTPKIKESEWTNEVRGIIELAKKIVETGGLKFEGVVIAGAAAGFDLTTFANNPKNKIDHIVIGARGIGFPKEIFFGSTSSFVLHRAKVPVTIIK
jgi:nucleotide-binding universal stress UspA family protein